MSAEERCARCGHFPVWCERIGRGLVILHFHPEFRSWIQERSTSAGLAKSADHPLISRGRRVGR